MHYKRRRIVTWNTFKPDEMDALDATVVVIHCAVSRAMR
jgi:hypothetical protein